MGKNLEDLKAKNYKEFDLLPEKYFFLDINTYRTNFLPLLLEYRKYFYSRSSYVSINYGIGEIKWKSLYCLNRFESGFRKLLEEYELSDHYYIFLHLLVDLFHISQGFVNEQGSIKPDLIERKVSADLKKFAEQLDNLEKIYKNLWPPISVKEEDGEIILESWSKHLKAIHFIFEGDDSKKKVEITDPILITQFIEFGFQKEMLENFQLYKGRIVPASLNAKDIYSHLRKELTLMIYNFLIEETALRPPNNQIYSAKIESFLVDYFELAGLIFIDKQHPKKLISEKSIKMGLVKSWIQSKIKQSSQDH